MTLTALGKYGQSPMSVIMAAEDDAGERFVKSGLGIREVLQEIEDALLGMGYDDFVVITDHGAFTWRKVKRARQEEERQNQLQLIVTDGMAVVIHLTVVQAVARRERRQ
jgi:hypothetical protein